MVDNWSAACDAINTNVWPAKLRGSKIIYYHGWADPLVGPLQGAAYYDQVLGLMGETETKEFYKFYPVPGMFHCGGGPGCGVADYLVPMIDWVENGIEPGALIGAHLNAAGWPTEPGLSVPIRKLPGTSAQAISMMLRISPV